MQLSRRKNNPGNQPGPVWEQRGEVSPGSVTLLGMSLIELLYSIDSEISTLKQVRSLLVGSHSSGSRRGRQPKKKRTMSAEARARIAAAQRRRWAKQKRAGK